jgi:hypothetical protein
MPAYLIAAHIITDAAKFDEYRAKVAPLKLALRKARTSELDMLITLDGVDAA